jgi:hypothetical protein
MKSHYKYPVLVFIFFIFLGCHIKMMDTSGMDHPFLKERLDQTPLKIVYIYGRAQILKENIMTRIWILGPATIVFHELEKSGAKNVIKKCPLPDYGQLVIKKFTEKVIKDFPEWPKMEEEVLQYRTEWDLLTDVKKNRFEGYNVLMFFWGNMIFSKSGTEKGLSASIGARIASSSENIWGKSAVYRPSNFGRNMEWDELIKDDCKLLKEEVNFAAEKTALILLESLMK